MKTKLLLTLLLSFYFYLLSSQVPQGFNYQAIARDGSSGDPITGKTMQVKIGILSDTILNTMVWEELFNPVRTNAFGMFNIVVGTGVKQSGSAASFGTIDWTKTPLFLRTSIMYPSPGTWRTMGTSKLQSVPYSMVAGNLEGSVPLLSVKGNTTTMDSALFVVRNNTGQIVFAVYNEGVRIYVDDGKAKGATKGGFAIGSFDRSKGTSQTLFIVDPDSIRAYIDTGLVKTTKGGFAIGSFDRSKAGNQQYFRVTQDSIRMYINDTPSKTVKGGFAIGGFDNSKGPKTQYLRVTHDSTRIITADTLKGFGISNLSSGNTLGYLRLTPSNYLIGHQAGKNITTGLYNSVLGYQSGYSINTAISNSFMGYKAGFSNASGDYNIFIGNLAGYMNNGSFNTFIGYISGKNNSTGYYNSFFGDSSGFANIDGYNNTFLGGRAGFSNTHGTLNTYVGNGAGYANTTGTGNDFIGTFAGFYNPGSENTIIGCFAGLNSLGGNRDILIGCIAGYSIKGSDNLIIGNSAAANYTSTGNYNLMLGNSAGQANTTGSKNVFIGYNAGYFSAVGSSNVFIGYQVGYNEAGSNKLYIDNTNTSSPLIWGDFSSRILNFNGKVGIGTSNPQATLEINGGSGDRLAFWRSADNTLEVQTLLDGVALSSYPYGGDAQNKLILQPLVGNVGIGTLSPSTKLHVSPGQITLDGTINPYVGLNNGTYQGYCEITSNVLGLTYNGSVRLAINASGYVGIGTTLPGQKLDIVAGNGRVASGYSWLTNSDVRYKKNISTLQDCLDKVMAIRGVSFDLISDSLDVGTRGKNIGFIAQELENVVPEVVVTGSDGYKAVAYDKITAVLTEAIKEQQKQIESQQKEIDELKTLVNSLAANQNAQGNK